MTSKENRLVTAIAMLFVIAMALLMIAVFAVSNRTNDLELRVAALETVGASLVADQQIPDTVREEQ